MPAISCLKFHGGKSPLAKNFWEFAPQHTRYCEPFCGGASVLFARPDNGENCSEFINDIDKDVWNFWKVLGSDKLFEGLKRFVETRPFGSDSFEGAKFQILHSKMDFWEPEIRAGFFFVTNRQSRQGLGESFATPTLRIRRGMNENVSSWLTAIDGLPWFHKRLRRVEVRNQGFVEFIKELDDKDTFFYCDPPYLHETRSQSSRNIYNNEMSDEQHRQLLDVLSSIKGKFMISGYHSEMYDKWAFENKYSYIEFDVDIKSSSKKVKERKIECIWMNYDPEKDKYIPAVKKKRKSKQIQPLPNQTNFPPEVMDAAIQKDFNCITTTPGGIDVVVPGSCKSTDGEGVGGDSGVSQCGVVSAVLPEVFAATPKIPKDAYNN